MGRMSRHDREFMQFLAWDMLFDGDLFGDREPVGCTPYIISAIAIGSALSFLFSISNTIISLFNYLLMALIGFTLLLPIVGYIRSKNKGIGIGDFIYVVLMFFNSIIAALVGYGILYRISQRISLVNAEKVVIQTIFYVVGFLGVRIFQNILWNIIIKNKKKEKVSYNG